MFFTFFRWYKWYQIAQRTTDVFLEKSEISRAAIQLATTEITAFVSWDFVQYGLVVDDSRIVVDEFLGSVKDRFYDNLSNLNSYLGDW